MSPRDHPHGSVRNAERLQRFIDNPWRENSADDLNFGLLWTATNQGDPYWRSIHEYFRNRFGTALSYIGPTVEEREPTQEDLDILKGYLPRRTPKDSFLEDKGNKEYVT